MTARIFLIRHGETEWSLTGRHTGRSDLPLTPHGEDQARRCGDELKDIRFAQVLTSPLQRAVQTCALALPSAKPITDADLVEWDYGDYEGLTSAQIRAERGQWNLFEDGAPGGESPAEISSRADRVVSALRSTTDDVAIFSHGHFLRALAARWIGLAVGDGARLVLSTASISTLGYEHDRTDEPALLLWNATS